MVAGYSWVTILPYSTEMQNVSRKTLRWGHNPKDLEKTLKDLFLSNVPTMNHIHKTSAKQTYAVFSNFIFFLSGNV